MTWTVRSFTTPISTFQSRLHPADQRFKTYNKSPSKMRHTSRKKTQSQHQLAKYENKSGLYSRATKGSKVWLSASKTTAFKAPNDCAEVLGNAAPTSHSSSLPIDVNFGSGLEDGCSVDSSSPGTTGCTIKKEIPSLQLTQLQQYPLPPTQTNENPKSPAKLPTALIS